MDINQRKIANIHDFYLDFEVMSSRLRSLKEKYPSGLILPVLGSDIKSPGLPRMVDEINQCDYLSKIYIALSADDPRDYEEALKLKKTSRFHVM